MDTRRVSHAVQLPVHGQGVRTVIVLGDPGLAGGDNRVIVTAWPRHGGIGHLAFAAVAAVVAGIILGAGRAAESAGPTGAAVASASVVIRQP